MSSTVTAEVVAAWRAGDYLALHRALRLKPWQASPLPLRCTALGCDQRTEEQNAAMEYKYRIWDATWPQAQELQRELMAIAGKPRKKGADKTE